MSTTTKKIAAANDRQAEPKATPPPKTMTALRDELLVLFSAIGTNNFDLTVAKEKSNAAGKIIKSASVQLEYAIARKERPKIPFLK